MCFALDSVYDDLFTVEVGSFACGAETQWLAPDRRLNAIIGLPGCQLVTGIVHDEADPWWAEHIVDIVVLMVAPVVADFADLVTLQVIIVAQQRVHVGV